jgi:hypothetical protein
MLTLALPYQEPAAHTAVLRRFESMCAYLYDILLLSTHLIIHTTTHTTIFILPYLCTLSLPLGGCDAGAPSASYSFLHIYI